MEQCSICLEGLDNDVTLACGHRFHAACLAQMASAVGTAATRRGALTSCPNCRAVSRVALVSTPIAAFSVGDRVSAWAPPASARRGRPPGPRRDRSAVVAPDPERAPTEKSSKFWGVTWRSDRGRWAAYYIDPNGKQRHIGFFDTQEQAARAYDAAIRTLPPDVQLQRKMNSADANGPLVPRVRNTSKKRDREEPAAPPAALSRRRMVSAPPPRERDDLDLDRTAEYLL